MVEAPSHGSPVRMYKSHHFLLVWAGIAFTFMSASSPPTMSHSTFDMLCLRKGGFDSPARL